MKIQVEKIDHHRNGIGGAPFYVALFKWKGERFVATLFDTDENDPEPGYVSVLQVNMLSRNIIEFGVNSWHGDMFEEPLRKAIAQWETEQEARNNKQWNESGHFE